MKQLVNLVNNGATVVTSATPNTLTTILSITAKKGAINNILAFCSANTFRLKVTVDGITTLDIPGGTGFIIGLMNNANNSMVGTGIPAVRGPNATSFIVNINNNVLSSYPNSSASINSLVFTTTPIPFNNSLLVEVSHSAASQSITYEYQVMTE